MWKPRSVNFMAEFLLKEHNFVGYGFSKLALDIWGRKISGGSINRVVQSKDASLIMEDFSKF